MQLTVFAKSLADHRRSLTAWALGSAVAGMMYASFYPQMRGDAAEALSNFPSAMREAFHMNDMTSAAGYLNSSVFGLILPLIAMFYGITTGARTIAGDEESGQLDQILAHPLTRVRLVQERFASLTAGAFGIAALVWLAMLAVRSSAELTSITPAEFAAQCLNLALLATTFGALALGLGAAIGRRGLVLGVSAALGVLSYALHTFGEQVGLARAAALSPFAFYIDDQPLKHGFQWGDAGALAATSLALVAVGALLLNRRDLRS